MVKMCYDSFTLSGWFGCYEECIIDDTPMFRSFLNVEYETPLGSKTIPVPVYSDCIFFSDFLGKECNDVRGMFAFTDSNKLILYVTEVK